MEVESENERNEENRLLLKPTVYQKFKDYMMMDADQFKWVANMVVLCFGIGEIVAFLLIRQSSNNMELPANLPDILLIVISLVEFLLAPFLGWFGYTRRRTVMMAAILTTIICALPLFVVPQSVLNDDFDISDLCVPLLDYIPPLMLSSTSTVRLCVALLVGVTFTFARIVVWAHSVAYLAEIDPDRLNSHFGIILIGRILGLVSASGLRENVEQAPWLAGLMILMFLLPPAYRIYLNPLESPDSKERNLERGLGYMECFKRVVTNKMVMLNGVSISFLAAALWTFAYYEKDIVKTMYQIDPPDNIIASSVLMIYYHLWILPIMMIGYIYSKPMISEYSDAAGLQLSNKLTGGSAVFLILLMFLKQMTGCQFGNVGERVGEYNTFSQPICSGLCLCSSPLNVYSPVCVPEEMTTYYSPCHAGCSNITDFNGIEVYSKCSCAGASGLATRGACSDVNCTDTYRLHQLFYLLILGCGLVSIQLQGTSLVRAADPRDKSTALGVLFSLVALVAFVLVHAIFMHVRSTTCAWNQHGICQLQTPTFVYSVGFTSVGLTAVSLIVSIATYIIITRKKETVI